MLFGFLDDVSGSNAVFTDCKDQRKQRRDRSCVSQPSFSVGFQPAYIQLNVTDKFIRSMRQTVDCSARYCSIAEVSQRVGALGPSKMINQPLLHLGELEATF